MLNGTAVPGEAWRIQWALGGFVAYNLETAQGIVAAAETTGKPVQRKRDPARSIMQA